MRFEDKEGSGMLDGADSDDSNKAVDSIPQEVKAPANDTDMPNNKPASSSSRKRPASEGDDMLKALGPSAKKRVSKDSSGHDGGEDPSLGEIFQKLEDLSQLLKNTIDNIQRSLDSLVKISNKNKESFWGKQAEFAKAAFDRPRDSDSPSDKKAAVDRKVVSHNHDQKKATERSMTFTGSLFDLALTQAFCGKLDFNILAKLFPDWDNVLHLFKENRHPSDSQAKELGVNFFKRDTAGRFPFYESYMQQRSSAERVSRDFFMMFYEALQKREGRNSTQRIECECMYNYLGDDDGRGSRMDAEPYALRSSSSVGMKLNPVSLHWNSTNGPQTIHPVEHNEISEYLPNLRENPLSEFTRTTFERTQARMYLKNDDHGNPIYMKIDALYFRSAVLYMMRTIIDRENFKNVSSPGGYEQRYKPTNSAAIHGLRQIRRAFSWRRIEGHVPETLSRLAVEFVHRFRSALCAEERTQSQYELHLQCTPKGSFSNKPTDGKIVKWVQASPTFDSEEYNEIKNLECGYVDNINKWKAHCITYLSDEIARILDMGDNQKKLSELYVPARDARGRAIYKIDSFIPNFLAVVADASRAK